MKIQCLAMGRDGNQCLLKHESGYCHKHSFYRELNDEQKQKITRCSYCKAFSYLESKCFVCKNEECYALMQTSERCTLSKHGDSNSYYCKRHEYWKEYDMYPEVEGFNREKILQLLQQCSSCKNYFPKKENELTLVCQKCQERKKQKKENVSSKEVVKCLLDKCVFKASGKGGEYYELFCGKHTAEAWKMVCEKENKKPCAQYVRGCRIMLEKNGMLKCKDCLQKDCINHHKRQLRKETNKVKEGRNIISVKKDEKRCNGFNNERKRCQQRVENENDMFCKYHQQQSTLVERGMKLCTNCNKEIPVDHPYNSCPKCLQEGSQKDKCRNVEVKRFEYNCINRKKENELTTENILTLSLSHCHYCGNQAKESQNGIDRVDNSKGYVIENVVPCCKLCNVMKLTHSQDNFLKMIEHISVYNGLIQGELCPDAFPNNYANKSIVWIFKLYRAEANKRNKQFLLTLHEFMMIQKNPCYLCGKENNELHKNGLDRIDNAKGYVVNNVMACCGNCNLMKHVLPLQMFLNKCVQITNYVNSSLFGNAPLSDDISEQVTKRLKLEEENKNMNYLCWANKVPQLYCQSKIRHQKHYCHHHVYLEKYSDLEISQLMKCNKCYQFGVLPFSNGCRECNRVSCSVDGCNLICQNEFTECVVHRNEARLCKALTDGRGICLLTCHKSNPLYCHTHLFWLNFTEEEVSQLLFCKKCLIVHLPDQCNK